jgi:hypothetical protein
MRIASERAIRFADPLHGIANLFREQRATVLIADGKFRAARELARN